jgi:hypothetical protein
MKETIENLFLSTKYDKKLLSKINYKGSNIKTKFKISSTLDEKI